MEAVDRRSIPRPSQVAADWVKRRTFRAEEIPPIELLHAQKRAQRAHVSVVIPASDAAATIGPVCRRIRRELMLKVALVDELVVLDAGSRDETVRHARAAGAEVVRVSELISEVPAKEGKGDVLWRSLTAVSGDIVAWLDVDSGNARGHAVEHLLAPLLLDPTVAFVKGYERPVEFDVEIDDVVYRAGNGRMSELLVRPLLSIFFPELGGFFDPLAGAYVGRTEYLRQIPFFSGCSVDVGVLIDLLDVVGLDGMAQVDLGPRGSDEHPLSVLGSDGHAIARTILKRAEERKRIKLAPAAAIHPLLVPNGNGVQPIRVDEIERPPIDVIPPYLAALGGKRRRGMGATREPESIRA